MRTTLLMLSLGLALVFGACEKEQQTPQGMTDNTHQVTVQEVLQTPSYTYLKVQEGGQSNWLAITKQDVQNGETLYYTGGLEMKDFESKDLNRTFDVIYFVDTISRQPQQTAQAHQGRPNVDKKEVAVEPAEGGVTIAKLYSNKQSYADKSITIRGKVTKVNAAIMGRNWVHLQDGTEANGNYDLTVTTNADVSVGDVVTFEGVIALDRDFGAGYAYDVIMEKAKLVDQQKSL